VKPSSSSSIPEAGIVMVSTVSGKRSRFTCHRSLLKHAGIMFAKSGNINAECPILQLKGVHLLFIHVKYERFLMGSDVEWAFHDVLPS
jgi:hypothetical protein